MPTSDHQSIQDRQRALYNSLWTRDKNGIDTPDLIRFATWKPWLKGRILDIGAGDMLLARTFPEYEIYSIDLATTGLHGNKRAVVGAAERLPFADGCFNSIVLSEVLEHVTDPLATLEEIGRVTTVDAHLMISVPNWPLSTAEYLYHRRKIGKHPTLENLREWDPNHERRYTDTELDEVMRRAGWTAVSTTHMFGNVSSAAMYWIQPALRHYFGVKAHIGPRAATLDKVAGSNHSGLAVVAVKG